MRGSRSLSRPSSPSSSYSSLSLLFVFLVMLTSRRALSFHLRSDHNGRYDFKQLKLSNPALAKHVFISDKTREETVDWSDSEAVLQFNKALLMHYYGVSDAYHVPEPYLVPPIPSRADYVHSLLTDLVRCRGSDATYRGIDIGTGANAIYPLVASAKYHNVQIVGTDIDARALKISQSNINSSAFAKDRVTLRQQSNKHRIFQNIIQPGEYYDFCMCNPPFFKSREEAEAATDRKNTNLNTNINTNTDGQTTRNFAGQDGELFYSEGGEVGFIKNIIAESFVFRANLGWCTALVSAKKHLVPLERELKSLPVKKVEVISLDAGQKSTRVLAWRF